jgi:Protein of unknown function (DUF3307)
MSLTRLGGVYALLHASHELGDHWIQTNYQAQIKGRPDQDGRAACARHVAGLTATHGLALAAGCLATGERLRLARVAAGLGLIAVTHYWADRRTTLAGLADRVGKSEYYQLGQPRPGHDDAPHVGTGAFHLDQAWHLVWLAVAAAIIASSEGR